MKKISCLVILFFLIIHGYDNSNIIAEDAIRVRILANSNSEYDQEMKMEIKDSVKNILYEELKSTDTSEDAKKVIIDNLELINDTVESELDRLNYDVEFEVDFGKNYFPRKKYDGVIYKEGEYDSLLITLGSGEGNNWWSVMFPPLCLLEENETEDVEYKSFFYEFLK